MNKAVFLDRDGTINVEKHYLYQIGAFEWIPGAVEGMRLLQDAGYQLIVVTNQSGIARGIYSERDLAALNQWMLDVLAQQGVSISAVYHCPHLPDARVRKYRKVCDCRKPSLGLFQKAIREHAIDVGQSWAVGDRLRDCAICAQTACRGFLIGETEAEDTIAQVKNGAYRHIQYAPDLLCAANKIVEAHT